MKTLGLLLALAACAGVRAAGIAEDVPASVTPRPFAQPALMEVADVPARYMPEVSQVEEAELPGGLLMLKTVRSEPTADPDVGRFNEADVALPAEVEACQSEAVAEGKALDVASICGDVGMVSVADFQPVEQRELAVFARPCALVGCSLFAIYAEGRFLSRPWSVSRRLEAARLRGDADEVRRLEELLQEAVLDAIDAEEDP